MNKSNLRFWGFFISILLFSIWLRLLYIFISPYNIDSDMAIVGLMAKHITEGEFPVFFYGHNFGGSTGPLISSLFFLIFGVSVHSLKFGTFIIGLAFTISLYFIGKNLLDKRLGVYAFIYAAVPPLYLLLHNIMPRCYYIETLLLGNIIFILAMRLVKYPNIKSVSAISFVCGIAFWNSPLCIYYLAAIAIFLLIKRFNLLRPRNIFIGVVFFVMGSLPVWYYNFTHGFSIFTLNYSSPGIGFFKNIKGFFMYQIPELLSAHVFDYKILGWGYFIIIVSFIIFFIYKSILKFRSNYFLFTVFFFGGIIIYNFSQYSSLNTQRHLLPLYSFFPIAVAYFIRTFENRWKWGARGFFTVIILFNLCGDLYVYHRDRASVIEGDRRYTELVDFLKREKINRIYADFWVSHMVNFISREEIICSTFIDEIYGKYAELLENADAIGIIGEFEPTVDQLKCLDVDYDYKHIGGGHVFYNIKIPGLYGESLDEEGWVIGTDYNSKDINNIKDRNFDTIWIPKKTMRDRLPYIQIDMQSEYMIYKITMLKKWDIRIYPPLRICVSLDGKRWESVKESNSVSPFFISGPRIYFKEYYGRAEYIFKPVIARYIRLEFLQPEDLQVQELFIYKYLGEKEFILDERIDSIKGIINYAAKNKIEFIFADYWESAKISEISNGLIGTVNLSKGEPRVEFKETVGLMSNVGDRLLIEDILNISGVKFEKHIVGDYILYHKFRLDKCRNNFIWFGKGLLFTDMRKANIDYLGIGDDYARIGDLKNAIIYYNKAISCYPNNYLAYKRLLNIYKLADTSKYNYVKTKISNRFFPKPPFNINFKNNIEFLGYNMKYKPHGRYIKMEYFWRLHEDLNRNIFVFVHFIKDKKIFFQNDHPLLEEFRWMTEVPLEETFKEEYLVKIPRDIPEGVYDVYIGLHIPRKERIPVLSDTKKPPSSMKIGEIYIMPYENNSSI